MESFWSAASNVCKEAHATVKIIILLFIDGSTKVYGQNKNPACQQGLRGKESVKLIEKKVVTEVFTTESAIAARVPAGILDINAVAGLLTCFPADYRLLKAV